MSNETIKISIIVPIYNVEDYIRPCIESIIGQTYRNLEIILVDDGSPDRCPEICDAYAEKDPRIHVIHKPNGGLVSARKAGAAAATGYYVLAVDGDDWVERDRVEILVRDGILPSHADMIHLSGYVIDYGEEGKGSVRCSFDVPNRLFKNEEIENVFFPLMTKNSEAFNTPIKGSLCMWAIRRDLLLRNQMLVDDRIVESEDALCIISCLLEAKSVMTIQQGGYHNIQRASSIMHQTIFQSDNIRLRLKIWYQGLKNQMRLKHASEKTCEIIEHFAISILMFYAFDLFLQKFPDYLFPFPKVSSGARIVVYGAGRFGNILVHYLNKTKKCSVVLWVDQSQNRPITSGYTISSRDAVFSADYDFIVVAIFDAATAKKVKQSFILDGIPEEKIATMDASVITEDAIPDEIKKL